MTGERQPRKDRRFSVPWTLAATAVLGVSMIRHGIAPGGPPQPGTGDAPGGPLVAVGPSGTATAAPLDFSTPVRVRIPVLGVNAPVTTVGPDAQGGIAAPSPTDRNLAGWFTEAPSPGERGTAVLDGHVDTREGPAVFYGLGALRKGSRVEVARADGRTAVFTVYGVRVFAKKTFPGDTVYGDTGRPELRVITCGGGFTKRAGYDSDVVVFARLSAVR